MNATPDMALLDGLESLGLDRLEERAYRILVERLEATPAHVAGELEIPVQRARSALSRLEAMGLASRTGARAAVYVPSPPEVALTPLIRRAEKELVQRERGLESARRAAGRLTELARAKSPVHDTSDVIEVIRGREDYRRRFTAVLKGAREEIIGFGKPPYATQSDSYTEFKIALLEKGVRGRAVYERAALGVPGLVTFMERVAAAGEQARTAETVPLSFTVVDRRVAILPLRVGQHPDVYEDLLVHPSALLEALLGLFELVWKDATPIRGQARPRTKAHASGLSAADQRLLFMIASGLRDEAIAAQLNIVRRTVERRVQRLMALLGARTRFQAGLLAGQKGWLDPALSTDGAPRSKD